MAAAARSFVEREEFDTMKKSMERLSIRVEVLTNDVHRLSNDLGDLAESVDRRFDSVEKSIRELGDGLRRDIQDLQKGQTAVLSAVLALGRR